MKVREIVQEDISRRNLLRGAGAAAALGGLGLSAQAQASGKKGWFDWPENWRLLNTFLAVSNAVQRNWPQDRELASDFVKRIYPILEKENKLDLPYVRQMIDVYGTLLRSGNGMDKINALEKWNQTQGTFPVWERDWKVSKLPPKERERVEKEIQDREKAEQERRDREFADNQRRNAEREREREREREQEERRVDNHRLPDGTIYTGDLRNGLPNGRGQATNTSGVIISSRNWVDGRPSGLSSIKFQSGITIFGNINKDDLSFTDATMNFTDGAKITGPIWKIIPNFKWTYAAVDRPALLSLPDGQRIHVRFNMRAMDYERAQ